MRISVFLFHSISEDFDFIFYIGFLFSFFRESFDVIVYFN